MKLRQAFSLVRGDVVAFTGAGGKTSLLVGLGYELAEAGWRVLATTATAHPENQLDFFPCAMPVTAPAPAISAALSEHQFVMLYDNIRRGRVYGPALETMPKLLDTIDSDVLLVEADKAKGLPFKAPREDEPRIPLETSLVVPVASLSVLGKPLNSQHIYNPQSMMDKYGFAADSPVKSPWLAQVLRDEELGMKGVPAGARVVAFLNQTPARGWLRGRARIIARLAMQSERIEAVAVGSARAAEPVYEVQRRVGVIVLAGGGKAPSIIARIAEQFIRSRMKPICVVAGGGKGIRAAVEPLGVQVIDQAGALLPSLQAGLRAMPENTAAALVTPGSQPRIQPRVIYHLRAAYARGEGSWLMPGYRGQRGFPMLIGRRWWQDILNLPPTATLGDVIRAHQDKIAEVPVDTDSVLHIWHPRPRQPET